jgi:hypothetical protein
MGRKKRSVKAKGKSEELSPTPTMEGSLMVTNLGDYTTLLPHKKSNIYDKMSDKDGKVESTQEEENGLSKSQTEVELIKVVQKDKKILVPRRGRSQNAKKVGQNVAPLDVSQVVSEPDGSGRTGRRGQKRKSSPTEVIIVFLF